MQIYTYGRINGSTCKPYSKFGCDPFIEIYANGNKVYRSATVKDVHIYKADNIFTTSRIPKNSTIELKIVDESSGFGRDDELILQTKGTVDSFLKNTFYEGERLITKHNKTNAAEIISFWQVEYKYFS